MVQLDVEMQESLRCPGCQKVMHDPLIDEEGSTLCRRCVPPSTVAFQLAVPNHVIAAVAGRQDFKDATRDASGLPLELPPG